MSLFHCFRALLVSAGLVAALVPSACRKNTGPTVDPDGQIHDRAGNPMSAHAGEYVGFDRNLYPGDNRLAELHRHFAYAGYWLNPPPGAAENADTPPADSWLGHRDALRAAGFGFLVLFNGRLEHDLAGSGQSPAELGRKDAAAALAAARQQGFPTQAILFLDQEEGGRLTDPQAAYFFAWTEAVAASDYRPGAYLSGQPAPDGTGPDGKPLTITTAQAVTQTIAQKHLHPVALWVAQDGCPPAPGCTLAAPPLGASGTAEAIAWQYAQSPRRPQQTKSCAATYAADNLCYAGATKDIFLDLNVANSPDPSHGR